MLKNTTKPIMRPIETGEYNAVFKALAEGKTDADTLLKFHLVDEDRDVNVFVNNARACFKDETTGEVFTSEDFFFMGLKRQLNLYGEESPLEVLNACTEVPVSLWVVSGEYTNVYSSKPRNFDAVVLGII